MGDKKGGDWLGTWGSVKLDHEVAVAAHEMDVPPVRVGGAHYSAVPGAGAFVEDVEVVAVEVHWVAARAAR